MGVLTIRILEAINLPRHIKRYFLIRKIERYTQKQKLSFLNFLINLLILAACFGTYYYIFFVNSNSDIKVWSIVAGGLLLLVYLIRISVFVLRYQDKRPGITQLVLQDDEGRNVRVWDIKARTSLIIGKGSKDADVDIDLTISEYASLISKQHAVLNYAGNNWYIEDIGSTNGSGLRRKNERSKIKIETGKPYKLNSGDMIYIANTKLLVK